MDMGPEPRRSQRVPLSIEVEISHADQLGQPRLERTHTLEVARNGARIATRHFHPVGSMIHLGIPHLGRSSHCRVVWCLAPANGVHQIGVEMDADGDLWGVHFDREGASSNPDSDLALLVQMLEEKRVFACGEFQARRQSRGPVERPSKMPEIVLT
jgi:hypothetical protein